MKAQSYEDRVHAAEAKVPTLPKWALCNRCGAESVWVNGLTPGTTYRFGVKTVDSVGNWSALSNIKEVTTEP